MSLLKSFFWGSLNHHVNDATRCAVFHKPSAPDLLLSNQAKTPKPPVVKAATGKTYHLLIEVIFHFCLEVTQKKKLNNKEAEFESMRVIIMNS